MVCPRRVYRKNSVVNKLFYESSFEIGVGAGGLSLDVVLVQLSIDPIKGDVYVP
jgi:hypothetical protein